MHAKGGTRDAAQVLSNGGAALLFALLACVLKSERFTVALCSALAACTADTWASEIGVFSRREPVSILTGRPVQKGLSGGVTALGLLSSLCGSALIAAVYAIFTIWRQDLATVYIGAFVVLLSGFAGSIIDSILGDTVQAKYLNVKTGRLTEKPFTNGGRNRLVRGFAIVTNDMVNLLSSLLSALLSIGLYSWL